VKGHAGGLEGSRASGLCAEGGPGLRDLIQGYPLGMRVGDGFANGG